MKDNDYICWKQVLFPSIMKYSKLFILAGVFVPILTFQACGQSEDNMYSLDYSNRISLCRSIRIASFNEDTEGWEGIGGQAGLTGSLEEMRYVDTQEDYGVGMAEGKSALIFRSEDSPADSWRGVRKTFTRPQDLSSTPILQFKVFTQEDRPAQKVLARAVLSDGRRRYEARTSVIPASWATPIFNFGGCPFLSKVKSMEISIMTESPEIWKNRRFLLDDIKAGQPLDWNFMLEGSSGSFLAENGTIEERDDMMRFSFSEGGRLSTSGCILDSRNGTFNPPLDSFNTLHIVMSNRSAATRLRLSFRTDRHDSWSSSTSKVFDIIPESGPTAYFFNLSDNPLAEGDLTGFRLEPLDAEGGIWDIDKFIFLKEKPIETYVGKIESCTATEENILIRGMIQEKFTGRYSRLQVYEAPMYKVDGPVDASSLDGLSMLYDGPVSARFEISSIPFRRPGGKTGMLGMRMLAVLRDMDGNAVKVAPYFWIENWRDFEDNPYAFELPDRDFNVLDYGARGDAFTDDTEAINRAIEACSNAGGGRVVIPGEPIPGTDASAGRRYVATNIVMKSNVDLHLEENAIIWQSGDKRDYKYNLSYYHNQNIPGVPWAHSIFVNLPLIQFTDVSNARLTGKGTVLMFNNYTFDPHFTGTYAFCTDKIHIIPIGINGGKNIEISDITVIYSPSYYTQFQYVSNLFIGNLKMLYPACSSGDGIGLAFCSNVKVVRAVYRSNDDALTLSSSYRDPRNLVSPWRRLRDGADHSVRNVTVAHCYLDCLYPSRINGITIGNVTESHSIAFVPWGKTNPDQQLQEIDGILAYDNILRGGWSVGVWPDTPFDGKPFTNNEKDDYSPIKNVCIRDNEYLDRNGFLWVAPTDFTGDTGIHSSGKFVNGDFSQGHAWWTLSGDAGAADGYGFARNGGSIMQGLYLSGNSISFQASVSGKGRMVIISGDSGSVLAEMPFDTDGWDLKTLSARIAPRRDYFLGIIGEDGRIKGCRLL